MGTVNHTDIQHWSYSDSKVVRQIEEHVNKLNTGSNGKKKLQNKRLCVKLNVYKEILKLNYVWQQRTNEKILHRWWNSKLLV